MAPEVTEKANLILCASVFPFLPFTRTDREITYTKRKCFFVNFCNYFSSIDSPETRWKIRRSYRNRLKFIVHGRILAYKILYIVTMKLILTVSSIKYIIYDYIIYGIIKAWYYYSFFFVFTVPRGELARIRHVIYILYTLKWAVWRLFSHFHLLHRQHITETEEKLSILRPVRFLTAQTTNVRGEC